MKSQRGSTLVLVMIVLFLLSVIGLSLVAMTESEFLIGSNHWLRERTLVETENGIHIAVARKVVRNDGRAVDLRFADAAGSRSAANFNNDLEVAPVAVIAERPCNFCEINGSGSYTEKAFRAVVHDVRSTGIRRGSSADAVAARQTLQVDIQLEPWKAAVDDATLWPE
jgi:hypothetical protein